MSHRKITNAAEESARKLKEMYLSVHERQLERDRKVHELTAKLGQKLTFFSAFNLDRNIDKFQAASAALKQRESDVAQMKRKLFDVESEIKRAMATADELDNEFDVIADLVEQKSVANAAVNEWRASVARLNDVVASHGEIKSEVEEKLKGFMENKYFKYLLEAGFGTEEWSAGKFRAAAHRLAARVCDFKNNKQSYDMLNSLLKASEQRVAEAAAKAEQRKANVNGFLENTKLSHGYYQAQEDAEQADLHVRALKSKAASILQELKKVANDSDSGYQKALKLVESQIDKMSDDELDRLVTSTEVAIDDEILLEIRNLRSQIKRIKEEIKLDIPVERESKEQYQRAKEAEEIIRSRVKTSSDYRYRNIDVSSLITGYALGSLSSSDISRQVSRAESYSPSSSSSSSSWGSSSSSSSSSFGGGGFSSSSSFGGDSGGFSTSDSF
ncbi:hypothetical protein CL689_07075 [Candidatus Saccharibacteria bacterium]|mgnify:CR=1 FL=1|nr:hypothetical protein [Candidatus Saccharibacteria bacterium]|tara:strand:- start:4704 stop:6032 length:1329 start_codon:yes stop_codon:yes gene_type:complete